MMRQRRPRRVGNVVLKIVELPARWVRDSVHLLVSQPRRR